eukprot:gene7464-540_t
MSKVLCTVPAAPPPCTDSNRLNKVYTLSYRCPESIYWEFVEYEGSVSVASLEYL